MLVSFQNFNAEVKGTYRDYVKYFKTKSLCNMYDKAKIGIKGAKVLKSTGQIQIWEKVGSKFKNNGKHHAIVENGWLLISTFKPTAIIEVTSTRTKYLKIDYLHKDLIQKQQVVTINGTDFSGNDAVNILFKVDSFQFPVRNNDVDFNDETEIVPF